jgi:hypothetical protein
MTEGLRRSIKVFKERGFQRWKPLFLFTTVDADKHAVGVFEFLDNAHVSPADLLALALIMMLGGRRGEAKVRREERRPLTAAIEPD